MGRAADSLERTRRRWNQSRELLEEKIRNFPIGVLAKQVSGRNYPPRNDAPRNRATRDLPFRADRDGLERAPVAIPVAPTSRCGGFSAEIPT